MLVFGNIIAIDENSARVRLRIPDMDDYETPGWIFVPQACTVKDKSYNLPAINTLVAAVMDDEMQDGCLIGALYNDEDVCILGSENIKYIKFEDGAYFKYDKTTGFFEAKAPNKIYLESPIIEIKGDITNDGNFSSTGQVSDKKSSMQAMRDTYNSHTHTCPDGSTSKLADRM